MTKKETTKQNDTTDELDIEFRCDYQYGNHFVVTRRSPKVKPSADVKMRYRLGLWGIEGAELVIRTIEEAAIPTELKQKLLKYRAWLIEADKVGGEALDASLRVLHKRAAELDVELINPNAQAECEQRLREQDAKNQTC